MTAPGLFLSYAMAFRSGTEPHDQPGSGIPPCAVALRLIDSGWHLDFDIYRSAYGGAYASWPIGNGFKTPANSWMEAAVLDAVHNSNPPLSRIEVRNTTVADWQHAPRALVGSIDMVAITDAVKHRQISHAAAFNVLLRPMVFDVADRMIEKYEHRSVAS